ncbi:gluconate:H+ symporter [Nocardiopsis sp. MG754419]|uniref:GntT/GntP/DsdX family permease n=1 Tax=Nocardiopsis sp. MG754419 TaxID=2259865 RepID=UPI001BA80289|nr:gluconate:H+ symporter [Nocardiopsis sp. MG754419]MBR8743364.1 transporter [Nocardiopsis sp. MG754419]
MNAPVLLGIAVASIAVLLILVMKFKLPAFIALLLVAVGTALASGIPFDEVIPTVIEGMGGTLGSVALLVGLGAMLGAIIEKTGGAEVLAAKFTRALGKERVGPALLIASAIFAIPIFFDVGFIILLPIMFSFAKVAGHRSPVFVGVPIAGLMVYIHNTVPPHPGVTGSSTLLGADIGLVTIVGVLLIVPIGFLAHYGGKLITSHWEFPIDRDVRERFDGTVDRDEGAPASSAPADGSGGGTDTTVAPPLRVRTEPGAGTVALMILLPIMMIATGTVGDLLLTEGSTTARVVSLIGQPAFALMVVVSLSLYLLGKRHGWGMEEMGDIMNASLAPAAIVVFVTGAGGVFAQVLTESGIGETISGLLLRTGVPIVLMAFLLATIFKVAQGSGTVATLAAAGLLQSTIAQGDFSSLQVTLIVLAIGCGSTALSHINDSGFWIASKFLGLSVADGLRTWTLLTTVIGWVGMAIIGGLWVVAT